MMQALIECDSLGRAHIKELRRYQAGDRLKPPAVVIRDNILTATAYSDSLEIKISWLEKELEHFRVESQKEAQIIHVEVNRLTWWQTLWVWIGRISAAAIVLLIIYKIIKNYVR